MVIARLKINNENAESIGRPIFDKIIQSFANADRKELIQHFPHLQEWMTVEIFDETVEVLNRLGEMLSSEYSDHSLKDSVHSLAWEVQYTNEKSIVLWELFLDDNQDKIKVSGFRFDR